MDDPREPPKRASAFGPGVLGAAAALQQALEAQSERESPFTATGELNAAVNSFGPGVGQTIDPPPDTSKP
jgi:hypothetical protein